MICDCLLALSACRTLSRGAGHKVTMSTFLPIITLECWVKGYAGIERQEPPEQLCPQSLCSEVNEWTAAVSIGEKTQGLLSLSAGSGSRNRERSQRWPVAHLSGTFLRPPRRCWFAAPKVLTLCSCSCCCCFHHCSAQGTSCPSTLTGKATLAWPRAPEISTTMKPRTKGICGTEGVRSR